jgi:hypothetical protein
VYCRPAHDVYTWLIQVSDGLEERGRRHEKGVIDTDVRVGYRNARNDRERIIGSKTHLVAAGIPSVGKCDNRRVAAEFQRYLTP